MDNRTDEIIKQYAKIITEIYNPKEIYLYGSYAKGKEKKHSDIDIAIIIESVDINEYMNIFGKLFSYAVDIDGRIEPNLFMDDEEDDKYSFLHEVKKTGRKIEV
jgi:predicted nucleotidyltransferase